MKKTIITKIDPAKIAALPTLDLLLLREMQGKDDHYLVRDAAAMVRAELMRRRVALEDGLGGVAVEVESAESEGRYPFRTDDEDPFLFQRTASNGGA